MKSLMLCIFFLSIVISQLALATNGDGVGGSSGGSKDARAKIVSEMVCGTGEGDTCKMISYRLRPKKEGEFVAMCMVSYGEASAEVPCDELDQKTKSPEWLIRLKRELKKPTPRPEESPYIN